jgi:hypothetical protein
VGVEGESERAPQLQPDRYYLLGNAGSFYFNPDGDNEAFESPEAALEWAKTQTVWQYGSDLDFSDGLTTIIVLGSDYNANLAAWDRWAQKGGEGPYPGVPVHNYAVDLGLVTESGAGS